MLQIKTGSVTADMIKVGYDPFDMIIRKYVYSFRNRVIQSNNPMLCVIYQSVFSCVEQWPINGKVYSFRWVYTK